MRSLEIQRRMDQGHPFWKQVLIQRQMHILQADVEIGMHDVEEWKAQFDEFLISGDREDFHFVAVRFDAVLTFVAASTFHAEFDLVGDRLQRLGRGDLAFEHMSVNVTAFAGETIFVMGWIRAGDSPAARLAQSFLDVADGDKAATPSSRWLEPLFAEVDLAMPAERRFEAFFDPGARPIGEKHMRLAAVRGEGVGVARLVPCIALG